MDILLNKQEYVVFLAAIMVSSGIIKDNNYFGELFGLLVSRIKSKRLLVFWVSDPELYARGLMFIEFHMSRLEIQFDIGGRL